MRRRTFLSRWLPGLAASVPAAGAGAVESLEALQRSWPEFAPPGATFPAPSEPVTHTDAEWRQRLDTTQYRVLRKAATERPFTSPLNNEHRPGVYVCAGCDLPVFSSAMKFDSGTGWPSFFTTIPGAFETKRDFLLILPRTEYHCARCGGHHGHVFDDGPEPTRERWCNNGVALRFLPRDGSA